MVLVNLFIWLLVGGFIVAACVVGVITCAILVAVPAFFIVAVGKKFLKLLTN
jgi:hypothetical protein